MTTNQNPFQRDLGGCIASIVSAAERIECVKSFTYQQCMDAAKLNGLQETVIAAIQRRIRKLSALQVNA